MCFYEIRELFLAEYKDFFPGKRRGKHWRQQVSGSLNDEKTRIGGKTEFGWKQIIWWLKYGRKISKERVQETRGALDLRKLLLFLIISSLTAELIISSTPLSCPDVAADGKESLEMHSRLWNQPGLTSSDTSTKQIKEFYISLCSPHLLPSAGVQGSPEEKSSPIMPAPHRNWAGKTNHLHCQRSRKYFLNCITVEQKASLSCRL